jgi:hypothetical protein
VSRGHSRVTGAVRLALAVWLMASAVWTLADPVGALQRQAMPMETILPLAGLSFAIGAFLLTGFMTRVMGVLLVGLAVWQITGYGISVWPVIEAALGAYFTLRGGGAWAMDIYVQKMQDRVRQRAINSPESS